MIPHHKRIFAGVAGLTLALVPALTAQASMVKPAIIGGEEAVAGQFPFMAEFFDSEMGVPANSFCSGTLIAPDLVLTAAHCVKQTKPVFVSVGKHTFLESKKNAQRVAEWHIHPGYGHQGKPMSERVDLAIARLTTPIDDIAPLAMTRTIKGIQDGRLVGYGHTAIGGTSSYGTLKSVEATSTPDNSCPATAMNAETDLCTRSSTLAEDGKPAMALSIDSGGAFITRNNEGDWELTGTISHGDKNERYNIIVGYHSPVVYEWIDSIMNQSKR